MVKNEVDSHVTVIVNSVATEVTPILSSLIPMTGIVPFKCRFDARLKLAVRAAEPVFFLVRSRRTECRGRERVNHFDVLIQVEVGRRFVLAISTQLVPRPLPTRKIVPLFFFSYFYC